MLLVQADALLGFGQQVAQPVDLLAQGILTLACRLQLFLDGLSPVGVEVGRLDLAFEGVHLVAANPGSERVGEPGVDHLRQAAELFLDGLGLADEGHQDAILGTLLVDEVMAEDLGARLELPVDPPVALLHPAGVPGHVEMEEVGAVGLEVQALAGRVGGDQDAEGMLARVGVEGELDGFPLVMRRRTVEDRDPVVGAVGPVDRGRELLMEIALGVVVLGEDEDPRVVPGCRL